MTTQHQYIFEGATDEETRLRRQSTVLDPLTHRFFTRAGIGSGMRVLDLGTGSGNVAAVLADLVGPEGHVLGVDRDPDALASARTALAGRPNVEFAQTDIVSLDGIDTQFDAVVGRAVLAHVTDVDAAVRSAARRVRPGGLLCLHEPDMTYDWTSVPTPLWDQLRGWLFEAFDRVEMRPRMGLELFSSFRRVGLPDPGLMMEAVGGSGADSPAFGWVNIFASLLPLLEKLEIATAEEIGIDTLLDRLSVEIEAADGFVLCPPMYGVWCTVAGDHPTRQ